MMPYLRSCGKRRKEELSVQLALSPSKNRWTHLAVDLDINVEPDTRSQTLFLHPSDRVRSEEPHRKRVVMRVLLHVDSVPVRGMGDGEDKVEERLVLHGQESGEKSVWRAREEAKEEEKWKRTVLVYPFCWKTPLPYANANLTGALKSASTSSKSFLIASGTAMIWFLPNVFGSSLTLVMRFLVSRASTGGGVNGVGGVGEGGFGLKEEEAEGVEVSLSAEGATRRRAAEPRVGGGEMECGERSVSRRRSRLEWNEEAAEGSCREERRRRAGVRRRAVREVVVAHREGEAVEEARRSICEVREGRLTMKQRG